MDDINRFESEGGLIPEVKFKQFVETQKRIIGPILVDNKDNILAQGKIGEDHESITKPLINKALKDDDNEQFERILKYYEQDYCHKFLDSEGNILDRIEAAKVAKDANQLRYPTTVLYSHLI